jgi:predicted dehydrogenase
MRAAVVGAGQISKQHLRALAKCSDVRTVGICDLSRVMAEAAADRFRIESWYTDYRRMIDEKRPDVVHILTPPSTHFAIASECLRRGAHVIAEKPIVEESAQLDELVGIARAEQRQIVEDHNYLFNRDVQYILDLVEQGLLGTVRRVDVDLCLAISGDQRRPVDSAAQNGAERSTAAVRDFLTHLCYLAYAFVGDHKTVSTSWRFSGAADGAVVDSMQALIEGRSATARIGFSTDGQPDSFIVRVQGTRMQVATNLFEVGSVRTTLLGGPKPLMPIRNMLRRGCSEWANAARSMSRKLSGGAGPYEGMWELINRFYANLKQGAEPPVSIQQIIAVNALYHEILRQVPAPCAC